MVERVLLSWAKDKDKWQKIKYFCKGMNTIFPPSFVRSLNAKFKLEETNFFNELEHGEQVTSIRLNPFKPIYIFDNQKQVPWCENGKYLDERPSFTADPLFHAGCYYVQEASSMFLEQILKNAVNLDENLRVLDLCAAPGGKSTLLASLLNKESLLVSNEIIKSRVPVLGDNLTRWGVVNTVVSNNDPKDFQEVNAYFDVMVVDAPCSGSGMFRKEPQAINEWSESAVQLCSQRQKRILADAYPALKQDGILIYSTCSFSAEENEDIADWLYDTFHLEPVQIPFDSRWGIVETISDKHRCFGYRFYPHRVKGEGFFICCFRKKDGMDNKNIKTKLLKADRNSSEIIKKWLKPNQDYGFIPVKDGFSIINKEHEADIQFLQSRLYLKKSGVFAGKIAGKDLLPDQQLAQSIILSDEIQKINLSKEEAIAYLRKDELKLNVSQKGWSLMCFENYGLGWAKVLPNRINNYYPKEIRILKEL